MERPFDLLDKLGTGRLTVLPSAMSSLRSELRVEDGPNGVSRRVVLPSIASPPLIVRDFRLESNTSQVPWDYPNPIVIIDN